MKAKLLTALEERFAKNVGRHEGVDWSAVRARLEKSPKKLRTLQDMEETGGEPRALGGALFCDRRFDQVFVYHNGAESYYAARGFRARLEV